MILNKSPRLILVRHGESMWNVTNKANSRVTRFTGWADVPLSPLGMLQARAAGRCLAGLWNVEKFAVVRTDNNLNPSAEMQYHSAYTSMLERSRLTYSLIAEEMNKELGVELNMHVVNHWRLNERHYGALVGLSKAESEEKLGEKRVREWRRSWTAAPPPMHIIPKQEDAVDGVRILNEATIMTSLHGVPGALVATEKNANIPKTESLADCASRVIPLLENEIFPRIKRGENVLIVAHSNTIRGMIKHIDYDTVSDASIRGIVIPSAIPLVYKFEKGTTRPTGPYSTLGMRAKFHVNQELLELSLAANQWMEMSENLDHQGEEFRDLIRRSLAIIKSRSLTGVRKQKDHSFMNFQQDYSVE
jgi:2,3-bisphosphoglycerate-dependent phosphoglycerate mutase